MASPNPAGQINRKLSTPLLLPNAQNSPKVRNFGFLKGNSIGE